MDKEWFYYSSLKDDVLLPNLTTFIITFYFNVYSFLRVYGIQDVLVHQKFTLRPHLSIQLNGNSNVVDCKFLIQGRLKNKSEMKGIIRICYLLVCGKCVLVDILKQHSGSAARNRFRHHISKFVALLQRIFKPNYLVIAVEIQEKNDLKIRRQYYFFSLCKNSHLSVHSSLLINQ